MNTIQDLSKLNRLKARHYVKYDGNNFPRRAIDDLTQYTNVDDVTLKRAPINTLEGYANALLREAERKEQAEAKRTAKRYDRSYVEKADYTITSLYSDYKTEIERGSKSWADYQQERKKWRRCKYKFCLNMFAIDKDNFIGMGARRSDSRFCCDECRKSQYTINSNLKQYDSYLPVHEIVGEQMDSVNDRERERTASYGEKELQLEHNKRYEFTIIFEDKTEEKALKLLK